MLTKNATGTVLDSITGAGADVVGLKAEPMTKVHAFSYINRASLFWPGVEAKRENLL